MKKSVKFILVVILSIIILLFIVRLITPRELDDVSPEIPCSELQKYDVDILYVIPNFNNKSISENKSWCEYILSLNKSIEIHGINHQPYRELLYENITQNNLTLAISEFEKCFNKNPEKFKPPQLKISKDNKKLILENNLELETSLNQITHKVYHCNDEGRISNKWINLF